MRTRDIVAVALTLTAALLSGCRPAEGPTEADIVAAVTRNPPAPATAGPTYFAAIESIQVEARGPYNSTEHYWPVRVQVRGGVKVKPTNVFQLGLAAEDAKKPAVTVAFTEEAHLKRDDFGAWRASYDYDTKGPTWRTAKHPGPASD